MKQPFAIKQQLYVGRSVQAEKAIRKLQLTRVKLVSNDIAITLADDENKTIADQFTEYQSNLEYLSASFLRNGIRNSIVFSISIRAYEYIPEISLPVELISALASLGASVDVDVINMVEPKHKP